MAYRSRTALLLTAIAIALPAAMCCGGALTLPGTLRAAATTAELAARCVDACADADSLEQALASKAACLAGGAAALQSWCSSGQLDSGSGLCQALNRPTVGSEQLP